ncbi:actin-related protein 2/3 complex subunit 1A-like [Homarus americanus]|uniref:actin-related protein 2/3 complex subunit 1A-like n=1 Tax=Homarus americanus TaxID=6706 RepID=UPI001C492C02|nr:actin-related protein 2/3 complex subunit 1A-like [Homarus americanus]XP_042213853.1 actin-related protein 2/3 complex subunit 1A-like [Homarus americanus]XP_042217933.1 actin-related protein 2/3 complex subunit 1A-like isoform X1 [Homarus americanus]XP_042217934.1 actin-related protein 2/3 complex subunit 1A-like isoform X1 [Homarus americanus]XP_042217935.1 actin-related protein 2/3 complex subunit 1A-like isoform X1 [Homarus americanus]XP_042221242.1 actin-related protein 2/3 complex sub
MTEVFRFGLVPIACRARNEDRSQVALSLNNNEVNIYGRAASEWKLQETLQGHDLRVTGIDWAPSTNRIVTCGANEYTSQPGGERRHGIVYIPGPSSRSQPLPSRVISRVNN